MPLAGVPPDPVALAYEVPAQRSSADPAAVALLAAEFRDLAVVKSGHGVDTLTGVDRATGTRVVVKAAAEHALSDGARLRLEHEAAVLESLDGAGLVPLLRHGTVDGLVYLVLPRVEGEPLDRVLARGAMRPADALAVARDLLAALSHAHAHGVLHRDVKPGNVIVSGLREENVSATLVDFGLARSQQLDVSIREQPVGTARYMAPEQAGLLHHEVDERSDLYAAGVLLFEALAGRPPFRGDSVGAVLRQHMTAAPPDLRGIGVAVPGAVDEIVQRLLRKDPRDRYQSAAGAHADVVEVLAQLAAGVTEPSIVVGAHDRRTTLTEPAFVGRESELAALAAEVDRAERGSGRVVLVEAESGGGKSRLLDEFAQRCAQHGVWVLRGQGVDQAAQRPFELLRGVAHDLRAADDRLRDEVVRGLSGVVEAVRDALPEIADLLPYDASETLGPEEHGEARSVHALARLLDTLGAPGRPAVVVLDDCQWADELTVSLLLHWQRTRPDDGSHLTVIAAFRTEEVSADHRLRKLKARRIGLPPFRTKDVRSLVESMAGPVPAEALDLVAALAAGSPFMASAVLRGLVESGALVDTPEGWRAEPDALRQAQSSREAAVFLARRLDLLAPPVLALLCAAAVLGKEFDLALAASLAGQSPPQAFAGVDDARKRHILWLGSDGARGTFVHDKLREALLARLDQDERRDLHLRAARSIEATDRGRVFELAYHFASAGDGAAALPYALSAGDQARAQHSLQVAEQQYRIAADAVEHADLATRRRVSEGLGDVLMLRGRYSDAERELGRALDLTEDAVGRARIAARLGEVAFKRGDVQQSIDRLEGALRTLGRWVPKNGVGYVAGAAWEAAVQATHTVLPDGWFARRDPEGPRAEVDILAARIYSRLAYSYWFGKGKVPCGWTHLREMNLLERYPPSAELAQAYSEHAPVATTIPWYARGIAYVERSYAIRVELGDVWGQGQSLHFHGVTLYAASRFDEALAKLTEAIRLLERTGDQWEINTAGWNIALCHYRLGDLATAAQVAQQTYRTAAEIGDHASSAIALSAWARSTGGNVPSELLGAELGRATDDLHTTSEVHLAEALRLLASGDAAAAAALIAETQAIVSRAGLHMEYVAPLLPWLATAQRITAERLPLHLGRERRRSLRAVARTARRGVRMARAYRNNLAHALREQGLTAALRGRRRIARRRLDASISVAIDLGMRGEERESRAAYVRLGAPLRWPGVDAHRTVLAVLAAPAPVVQEDAAPPTLSLADRFDGVLRAGRGIASALTPDAVFAEVRTSALALLRAESCAVMFVDPATGTFATGESSSGISSELMRRALSTGEPVTWGPTAGDATDSLVFSGTRSALAAPILVRGRVVACFGVTHGHVSGLFDEDEVRLAGFVSAIAGAALENAEGFAAVQELSRSLEQRVAERTAEVSEANAALREALHRLETVNAELRALDEMKSDFVAMVSHELKTPLTSILGYSSTMLRYWSQLEEPDRQEYVRTIDRQSHRLARLVSDLLEMSRIEAGYLEPRIVAVDVADAVAAVLAAYDQALDVEVDVPAGLCVRADADHLQQILTHFLDNAGKYGAPPVRIEAAVTAGAAVIAVCDNGPGVAEPFLARLFDTFAQASTGSRREGSGIGLGLSIVRGLARAGGGEAWYEPNLPSGARFCVRFRVA